MELLRVTADAMAERIGVAREEKFGWLNLAGISLIRVEPQRGFSTAGLETSSIPMAGSLANEAGMRSSEPPSTIHCQTSATRVFSERHDRKCQHHELFVFDLRLTPELAPHLQAIGKAAQIVQRLCR
jgi:hypothetical protein